ncbi:arsenic transporter [Allorhizobium taibaishanense]|uniref:Arsenic transporter n=1 Tax=Allorhizobium taibaishanense TaxID=887144 RepID=A0A1Q9A4K0_9HYPH|nr:arsenic transporter [Allorhizobium taibaishanense]MBB4006576.1 arsenical pump membrane protein [Allorhizobium taibaishanense]OLP49501.1 arsenic transporter [Allorhizobium taibaishanense]
MTAIYLTWGISALSVLGVISRPFGWPEAIWAVLGAAVLLALGQIGLNDAWAGIAKGYDVYLFLIGMMLLSELARREGLFDWLAALATQRAKGSPVRLFVLLYGVGVLVTAFLSNDATAVVLTPAVYAATKAAKLKNPMPYLLICAFIANAASFVLPISNPANLVIFGGGEMPPLSTWLATFALPSVVAIVVTFTMLYWSQRKAIREETLEHDIETPHLSRSAKLAGYGLVLTAVVLMVASAIGLDLGLPTFIAGVLTTVLVLALSGQGGMGQELGETLKGISWSVLPLVAGLFVLVEALDKTGLTVMLAQHLSEAAANDAKTAAMGAGLLVGFLSNLVNNLPAGLVAGATVQSAHVGSAVSGAVLVGVDLGPNLSVTGSLATILWLAALRREGLHMGALDFLKIGAVVMIPALVLSLLALVAVAG